MEKMTVEEQYLKETGSVTIWKIPNHTHTDEYVKWIAKYAKSNNSLAAKTIRKFVRKNRLTQTASATVTGTK